MALSSVFVCHGIPGRTRKKIFVGAGMGGAVLIGRVGEFGPTFQLPDVVLGEVEFPAVLSWIQWVQWLARRDLPPHAGKS